MNIRNICIIAGAAMCFATAANAGSWHAIGYNGGNSKPSMTAVDLSSITRSGTMGTVWQGTSFVDEQEPGGFHMFKARWQYDCAGNRGRVIAYVLYDYENNVITSHDGAGEWSANVPDSIAFIAGAYACGTAPPTRASARFEGSFEDMSDNFQATVQRARRNR